MCEKPFIRINKETGQEEKLPCGKCVICRKAKCREWAIKLEKESQYHKHMCMLTLTFRSKFLLRPKIKKLYKFKQKRKNNGELEKWKINYTTMVNPTYIHDVKKTGWLVTLFLKKLRKWYYTNTSQHISYFAVGEHGTQATHRAHWHILVFGLNKNELETMQIGVSKKNYPIYYSKIIEKLWSWEKLGIGKHTISEVKPATIKYVANYTMKKMYKEDGDKYPTIMRFSNNAKISAKWCRRYHEELRKGYLKSIDGTIYPIPKGYIKELKRYENEAQNASMNETLAEIESIKDEIWKKRIESGIDLEEENKKKAKRIKFKLKMDERDYF